MADAVRVKGIKELQRALRVYNTDLSKKLRKELKEVGLIVQVEARLRFQRYSPRSAAGYKVRVRQRGVSVEQSLRKTTGLRPDWGSLQMRTALLPALVTKEPLVVARVERMLDNLETQTF
jgi:hypothetical protein